MATEKAGRTGARMRSTAALIVVDVIGRSRSLDEAMPRRIEAAGLSARDSAWVRELGYGVIRRLLHLEDVAGRLLKRPMRDKDLDVYSLLLAGIYQMQYMRTAEHAAISETVEACVLLGKPWARKLVNGCLRNLQRNPVVVDDSSHQFAHPEWLAQEIRSAWPDRADSILEANNIPPHMCLRVNTARTSRDALLEQLAASGNAGMASELVSSGIVLANPVPVAEIAGFPEGDCSVQDVSAQLAAWLLNPLPGEYILDACAAPGGKTGHLLELVGGEASLTALDEDPERLEMVSENLARLGLEASCKVADASDPASWWDGNPFDRILVDAPCSGSGVIRRHPDIRHLRRPGDIDSLTARQGNMLDALWETLRPGGTLLYSTCSILPRENQQQIEAFCRRHPDAVIEDMAPFGAIPCNPGMQLLPGDEPGDGFYYCLLRRSP